jgi:hypothetical protein
MQLTPTTAEKSRLLLRSITKGNPQAIMVALDELKSIADEALQGTLDTAKRQALQALQEQIDRIQRGYEARLTAALASLETLIEQKVKAIEPRQGERGADGHTPTRDELLMLIEPLIPFVKDGTDGTTPGKAELIALVRPLIAETVANMQPTILGQVDAEREADDKLAGMIEKAVADKISQVKRFSGGGSGDRVKAGSGVAITTNVIGQKVITATGSFGILDATGDIDDTNVDFTFISKPSLININGAFYREDHGWAWDAPTLTATLDNPVGTDGDIYGIA